MENFIIWLFSDEHIFTLVTVILSGLISWIISACYFMKSNRDALRANVLYPMKRILEETYSWKGYNSLVETSKQYSSKYLYNSEQIIVDNLLSAYRVICRYNYESVCAESLFTYFKNKLEQNGINTTPIPVYYEDEVVDVEFPSDLLYMTDDLARVIRNYPPEYDEEICLDQIISIFNIYCKSCYSNKEITYFDDHSLKEILKKSPNSMQWEENFANYNIAKEKFLNLSAFK